MIGGGFDAEAFAAAWGAAARQTPAAQAPGAPHPRAYAANPPDQCPVHPGVKWWRLTEWVTAELEPPCFICDPGWWDEHPPPPVHGTQPPATEPESPGDLVAELRAAGYRD